MDSITGHLVISGPRTWDGIKKQGSWKAVALMIGGVVEARRRRM
jgi:hypothetical protein